MAVSGKNVPIYFILAPSYHGVSALSWKLNSRPEILSLGTGNPPRNEDPVCSCGEPVSSCLFWTEVRKVIDPKPDDPFDTLLPTSPYLTKNKTVNAWINGAISLIANETTTKSWKMVYEQAEMFFKKQELFLGAAQDLASHKIYVDAERSNLKFMTMASMGFPVRGGIHVVRDPRAYAAALKKYYPESTAEKLALEWVAAHTRINRLKDFFPQAPFITIRYEDFMAAPDDTAKKIADFMHLPEIYMDDALGPDPMKNHMLGLGPQDQTKSPVLDGENWRETLHLEDQERIVRASERLFVEFGYKP